MDAFALIPVALALLLMLAMAAAPALVLRGGFRSEPWLMIGAAVLLFLSVGAFYGFQYYFFTHLWYGGVDPDYERLLKLQKIVGYTSFTVLVASLNIYAYGFLRIARQWGRLARKAEELERFALELANRRVDP